MRAEIAQNSGRVPTMTLTISNLLFSVAESDEYITLPTDFKQQSQNDNQNNNLHFYINAPGGTVQIGNCCIFLRINFDESLIHKLQNDGDIHGKLKILFFTL